jgi:hypothetical protein
MSVLGPRQGTGLNGAKLRGYCHLNRNLNHNLNPLVDNGLRLGLRLGLGLEASLNLAPFGTGLHP